MKKPNFTKIGKDYILECIDSESYLEYPLKTNREKVKFLKDTFESETQWNIDRVGTFQALRDWLQGLPSCLHIDFCNYDIIQLAIKWGSISEQHTEKQADKILENYWPFLAMKIQGLFNDLDSKNSKLLDN